MGFIDEIKAKAKSCKKTIVLPESEDIRSEAKKRSLRIKGISTSQELQS